MVKKFYADKNLKKKKQKNKTSYNWMEREKKAHYKETANPLQKFDIVMKRV